MSHLTNIKSKLFSIEELEDKIGTWRENGDKIIFTNGCFDIVHKGHIEVLAKTADLGNKLIIGLNSDNSIKKK
jgi:bifunctional ADP-heptose synthase (sugar kinase/adenylyltransferase)